MILGNKTLPSQRANVVCRATKGLPKTLKVAAKKQSAGLKQAELLAVAGALLVTAPPSLAEEAAAAAAAPAATAAQDSAFDAAVDSLVSAVQASGTVIKSVDDAVISAFDVLQQGYGVAAPVISEAVKTATPVIKEAWDVTSSTAGPAIKSLLPSVQSAGNALEAQIPSGLTDTTTKTASEAFNTASPFLAKFAQFVASSEPLTLAEYALALAAFVYLAPALFGLLRGYSDDVPSAAALNILVNEGDSLLVDIRTAKEKDSSGVPDLPSSASSKSIEVEFAVTEDKKLRGQLRNIAGMESQITALQIASLKRVNKGTKVLLLDKNGTVAKAVAKELARKGFGSVFVIDGGFDGRNGWIQSKLQIKPSASFLVNPRRLGSTSTRRGSTSTRNLSSSKAQLPAPKS